MAGSIAAEKDFVDHVLQQQGVDFRGRVYFSTDPEMQRVLAALDRSEEDPIPGLRKRLMPLVVLGGDGLGVQVTLDAYTKMPWHCHKKHVVQHEVTSGHVIVERRKRTNGVPVEIDGKFVRETARLNATGFWIAWVGEPYAFWTEEEAATTSYRHADPGPQAAVNECADPTARAEDP